MAVKRNIWKIFISISIIGILSCGTKSKTTEKMSMETFEKGTYGYDYKFLKKYSDPIELASGKAKVLILAEYQGRVMTSSANGESGLSYGWINHDFLASGKVLEQFNPVGGEERFWLGPEGGQFSLYFPNGSNFDFADWQVPPCIDTEPFDIKSVNANSAVFTKSIHLKNYSNFEFEIGVEREITLLSDSEIQKTLDISYDKSIKTVGYETKNQLTNNGTEDWEKEKGLVSVWLLGMFNPSDEVTIIVPYKTEVETGYIVKDDYFGKITSDRLKVKDGVIYFKGDGKQRGKIGVPPLRAMPLLGSYDALNKALTIVRCDIKEGETDYVNSAWEIQDEPYKGDAINSYNDGPLEDGTQMGPFYELESSSPALKLKVGEKAVFKQSTFHFEGSEEDLDSLCQQIFNIGISEIKAAF